MCETNVNGVREAYSSSFLRWGPVPAVESGRLIKKQMAKKKKSAKIRKKVINTMIQIAAGLITGTGLLLIERLLNR